MGFPGGSNGKESACNEGDSGLKSWDRKIPWRKTCKHNPIFLLGKTHGQKSLAGYIGPLTSQGSCTKASF